MGQSNVSGLGCNAFHFRYVCYPSRYCYDCISSASWYGVVMMRGRYVFTLMAVGVLALLSISPASASSRLQETVTPTPPVCMPSPTPTSRIPTVQAHFTPVIGTPCADCTSTPSPVPSASPTVTSTPVPLSTPVGGGLSCGWDTTQGITCEVLQGGRMLHYTYTNHFTSYHPAIQYKWNNPSWMRNGGTMFNILVIDRVYVTANSPDTPAYEAFWGYVQSSDYRNKILGGSGVPFWEQSLGNGTGYREVNRNFLVQNFPQTEGMGGYYTRCKNEWGGDCGIAGNSEKGFSTAHVWVWITGAELPSVLNVTPTPTATPDCVPDNSVISSLLDFSPVSYGDVSCYTIIPQLLVDTPSIISSAWFLGDAPEQIGIVGLQVCTVNVTFALRFLDFDILAVLGWMVSMVAVAMIYRTVTT